MRDGRVNRAIQQGKARTTDIKTRVPELRERVPELRERVPELTDQLKNRGSELRTKGVELRTKGVELRTHGSELARQYAKMDVSWARCSYAKAARAALLSLGLGPMIDYYVRKRVVGGEVFDTLSHPVVFVANHSSHLDTPTILRALPRKWRSRTAVAAAADYFYNKRWKANGVALLFNTVPLGRMGGGLGSGATDHVDRLIDDGWNLVMFPEGTRSRDGKIGKVRSGAAVIAAQHGIDVVPIYLSGTHEAMPPGQNWPQRKPGRFFSRRHKVEVRFGDPIRPRAVDNPRDVMDRVRAFWDRKGLAPVPAPAPDPAPRSEPALAAKVVLEPDPGRFRPVAPPAPPAAPMPERSGTTAA
ncbi:MAG: 1-acyl-sn-glycerol-3-phosphate acyltransferase [Thermoleophilaceae bacterium]|nr:1-acyl-sn-glycerol-3-phosphate acyltransferase [Thermoleophilaceae bacterium]